MTALLIVLAALAAWCVVPLPLAIAVGRALRAADEAAVFAEIVRDYDAAGV